MIQQALKLEQKVSQLKLFMRPLDIEFFEVMDQLERTAKGYAKRKGRGHDLAFVDECIAEAWFIVYSAMAMSFDQLLIKYPDKDLRFTFYRMTAGYALKAYWSYRPTSTVSYLKSKGIIVVHEELTEGTVVVQPDLELDVTEDIIRSQLEYDIVVKFTSGVHTDVIAVQLKLTEKQVNKILRRVRSRLCCGQQK